MNRFEQEKPKNYDNPLSKKIEEYFGLREKRLNRKIQNNKFLEEKRQRDEERINKLYFLNFL